MSHIYEPDGIADHRGEDRCARHRCGLPKGHDVHQLPDYDDETGRAILGEHPDNEGDQQ